ncbi:MAG: hypothetical protein WBL99_02330, partial [Candidatus Acidiferrales bacterium]
MSTEPSSRAKLPVSTIALGGVRRWLARLSQISLIIEAVFSRTAALSMLAGIETGNDGIALGCIGDLGLFPHGARAR